MAGPSIAITCPTSICSAPSFVNSRVLRTTEFQGRNAMNVLTGVLRKDIRKIKDHFSQIYAGLANLFVAAGYHVSYDGTGIHVWDPDRKNPGQLEGLVASTYLFIGEIYCLIFN